MTSNGAASGPILQNSYQRKMTADEIEISRRWARYASEVASRSGPDGILTRGERVPHVPAVYLLADNGRVRYVGQTDDLHSRTRSNMQKPWQRLAYVEMPEWWGAPFPTVWLYEMEALVFERYKPDINRCPLYCEPVEDHTGVREFLARWPDALA